MERLDRIYLDSNSKYEYEVKIEMPGYLTNEDMRSTWYYLVAEYSKYGAKEMKSDYVMLIYENGRRSIKDSGKYELKKRLYTINDEDIGAKFTLSSEDKIDIISSHPILIRDIHRVSYQFDDYRIDFSIVKTNKKTQYEIEIEWTNKNGKISPSKILYEQAKNMFKMMMRSKIFYGNKQRNLIISKINNYMPNIAKVDNYMMGFKLYGPKPVDLRQSEFSSEGYFKGEIYVSHKVDGIKKGLMIDGKNAYFIDGQYINWISDAETSNRSFYIDGELFSNTYYPFEVYYSDTGLRMGANYSEKLKFINSISDFSFSVYKIIAKRTLSLKNDFFDVMRFMFADQKNLKYPQDGFIFTPEITEFKTITDKFTKESRKWKPEKNMTIDFELEQDKNIFFLRIMKFGKLARFAPEGKEFFITKAEAEGYKNGDIVECSYQNQHSFKRKGLWHIVRNRTSEKSTPNPYKQAMQIWDLIFRPITKEQLIGDDIGGMRNYHRRNKREMITEAYDMLPNEMEEYPNPHLRNAISANIKYTVEAQDKTEKFSYLPSYYRGAKRNRYLLALEFIYSHDSFDNAFCLIGFDEFFKNDEFIQYLPLKNGLEPKIRIIKENSGFPRDNRFHLISFPRDDKERNLQLYAMSYTAALPMSYIIKMELDRITKAYFITYYAEKIIYPICEDNDLYLVNYDVERIETDIFMTKECRQKLDYFNKYLRRAKYDNISSSYFDDCYACKREVSIYTEKMGLDMTEEENGRTAKFYDYMDSFCGESINSNLPMMRNTAIDIGIGQADRWSDSHFNVLGLEPNEENFMNLIKRTKNMDLYPINMGLYDKYDIREVKQRMGNLRVGFITSFDSLTFFYKDINSIQLFIDFIDEFLDSNGGIFSCITLDAMKLLDMVQYSKKRIEKFYIKRLDDKKINISLGKESIVQNQIEYIISFDDLIMRLERIGCHLIKDIYLDQEKLMTYDEFLYSSSTRCLTFKREPFPKL